MVETPSQQNLDSRMTFPTAFVVVCVMLGLRDAETPAQSMYARWMM